MLAPALFLLAAGVGLGTVPLMARLAPRLGLIDLPSNGHKTHSRPTPRTGGLALALAVITALTTMHFFGAIPFSSYDPALLVGVFGFLVFGFSSDLYEVSPELRFAAQVTMMLGIGALGLKIQTLGALFGSEPVVLGTLGALLFTALAGSCLVNGFNMLDGLDGLLVALTTPMLAALLALAYFSGSTSHLLVLAATTGGLLAFACFNVRIFRRQHALVFLGDAGSYGVGAIVTLSLIALSQTGELLRPIDAVWIAGLPILDTVNVVISRSARATHFMRPGQDHIHHLLLSSGCSSRQVVFILGTASASLCAVALAGAFADLNETLLCGLFLLVAAVYRLATSRMASRFSQAAAVAD